MPTSILKRPRAEDRGHNRPTKKTRKFKKQTNYHSSSEEEDEKPSDFTAINLQDSDDDAPAQNNKKAKFVAEDENEEEESDAENEEAGGAEESQADSDATGGSDSDSDLSETSTVITENGTKKKRKRNDPTAFATSISKILSTKLTTQKRADPVLSRSAEASKASKALADSKLEAKARQKIRAEKKLALEKGRVRDVLGLDTTEESTEGIMERERKLKKTAQRGVVKLFNAVREAQKRGDQARQESLSKGVVGMDKREEKVSEMSKQGFLNLISSGGKKTTAAA